jgi:hypothetical protein
LNERGKVERREETETQREWERVKIEREIDSGRKKTRGIINMGNRGRNPVLMEQRKSYSEREREEATDTYKCILPK